MRVPLLLTLLLASAAPVAAAVPADSAAGQPRRFVAALPFRDEINYTPYELDQRRWSRLGGHGDLDMRRRALLLELARAEPGERQRARWNYARFLIHGGAPLEAVGVLHAMRADEPRLDDVPAFNGALGIAHMWARRYRDGLEALARPGLLSLPEACLWRVIGHERTGNAPAALLNWRCAAPGMRMRHGTARHPFLLAATRAAIATGDLALARETLDELPRDHHEAMLWRGVVAIRRGEPDLGERLLMKARDGASFPLAERAELMLVQFQHERGRLKTREAIKRLDALRFVWRGGGFERDLLATLSRLHEQDGNLRGALAAGAPLIRYLDPGAATIGERARLQALIGRALDPTVKLTLSERAGLYWDYRDLAPQGVAGDAMIRALADQIAGGGLYRRAADLIEHQIDHRLAEGARAVVAVRVARWRLLAAQPQRALDILQRTEGEVVDSETRTQRRKLAALALLALRRGQEAFATLDGVTADLTPEFRAELYWQARDWPDFLAVTAPLLTDGNGPIDPPMRTMIVRRAIAAALAGDEAEIARLSARYGWRFADGALASAFQLITGDPRNIDQAALDAAMRDIDQAAPAISILSWAAALAISGEPAPAGRPT